MRSVSSGGGLMSMSRAFSAAKSSGGVKRPDCAAGGSCGGEESMTGGGAGGIRGLTTGFLECVGLGRSRITGSLLGPATWVEREGGIVWVVFGW